MGVSLCCSSSVHASCGDYLVHGPGAMLEALGSSGTASPEIANADPVPAPAPCRGPNCRSQHRTPAAPTPTIEIVVERWAQTAGCLQREAIVSGMLPAASERTPSTVAAEPLTPPPRAC